MSEFVESTGIDYSSGGAGAAGGISRGAVEAKGNVLAVSEGAKGGR